MNNIIVTTELCNGCRKCVKACDRGAVQIINKKALIDLEKCDLCGMCVDACKYNAITINKVINKEEIKKYKNLCVFVEYNNNQLNQACLQVVSKAYELNEKLNEKLTVVLVVNDFDEKQKIKVQKELSEYGVDNIKILKSKNLDIRYVEDVANIISTEILEEKSSIFLVLGDYFGRELAPRIATKVNAGLTADCTNLKIDNEKNMVQVRPTYGGKILASIISPNKRPQMASVRPNIFEAIKHKPKNVSFEIKDVDLANTIREVKKIISSIKIQSRLTPIDEAEIIVCGGRGIGSKDNFKLLEQLAQKLNGAVAGTREVVDRGWIDFSHQIGQTGKAVRPGLYIGCGVSGAIHHLIGMKKSKTIIAINTDRKAALLKIADVAIVGDLFKIIPELIANL
jgi:electron transfer flavoprotein alpha subunit/NAD-dependent dihydropyrimidine dehydrogenase PreA subunit